MNKKKILTVPEENKAYKPYYMTGNHYVGIPLINPDNGGIESINVISMATNALIEFYGSSICELIKPYVMVNGENLLEGQAMRWDYEENWIPKFTIDREIRIQGKIFAPIDTKGFIYELHIKNNLQRGVELKCGIEGNWQATKKTIYTSRLLRGTNDLYYDRWTDSIVMDFNSVSGTGAFAIGWDFEPESIKFNKERIDKNSNEEVHINNNGKDYLSYKTTRSTLLQGEDSMTIRYYVSVNLERDGARTNGVHMKRLSVEDTYHELTNFLAARGLDVKDSILNRVMNQNLFFNYFYALGRTIDTEEVVMMTSRSPRYYVSAAFWPRDTFLWSYPALLLTDTTLAREVLLTGFTRHIKNAGIHSHYINGSVLYPGFELDQLCSYIIALKGYMETTKDDSILSEEIIIDGLKRLYEELMKHKHPKINLYDTFLDPSDDQVTYPYLIYNNVLVYTALKYLNAINERLELIRHTDLNEEAEKVREAIFKYGIMTYKENKIFVWSVDGEGAFEFYDNPPGSLMTFSHYGFIDQEDELFKNTIEWIHSKDNPYYCYSGDYQGVGCLHAKGPWILGIANSILAGNKGYGRDILNRLFMDNGFACETVDSLTGIAKTGNAFATCGGFLAYAIYMGFGKDSHGKN